MRVAYVPAPRAATVQRTAAVDPNKGVWLQLAAGRDAGALSKSFGRMKRANGDLFDGITAYVAQSADRARLVIGPFRAAKDASIFAEDLNSAGISASRWTNTDSARIVPLGTE